MSLPIRRLIGLAERCVFGKQSVDSIHCGPTRLREQVPSRIGHPFFRSYGAILPSSFCKTHSSTLGSSPHLPVSVYGTGTRSRPAEAFLGSMFRTSWLAFRLVSHSPLGLDLVFAETTSLRAWTGIHQPADRSLLRHPCVQPSPSGTGILTCFPSVTPFGLT